MPVAKAHAVWHKPSNLSNAERLSLMPGWKLDTAYRLLGKRDVARGRPRKPK